MAQDGDEGAKVSNITLDGIDVRSVLKIKDQSLHL